MNPIGASSRAMTQLTQAEVATPSTPTSTASTPSAGSTGIASDATPSSPLSGLRAAPADEAPVASPLLRRGAVRGRSMAEALDKRHAAKVELKGLDAMPQVPAPHYERREMPTDAAAISGVLRDAQLASFPYLRDAGRLPEGWSPREDLAGDLRKGLGVQTANVEQGQGVIVDRGSGLTAVVLHDTVRKELVLSFGGTTAGQKVGDSIADRTRPGANFKSTMTQWGANLYAGLGGTPKSYRQAASLVSDLQQRMTSDPALAGQTLRVVGHSKGGGEAMFASLSAKTPVPVTAFCPAHLSEGLIRQLPAQNLAQAKALVSSYSPFGDPVAAMRGKLPRMPGVGAGYHFDGIPSQGAMHRHDRFHEHVAHWCAGAQAASPRHGPAPC